MRLVLITVLSMLLPIFPACSLTPAFAGEGHPKATAKPASKPASHMAPLEAAQLDAALAHLRVIEIQKSSEEEPYIETVSQICARYGIDLPDLGHSVLVNFKSGAITRRAKMQVAKAPEPKTQSAQQKAPHPDRRSINLQAAGSTKITLANSGTSWQPGTNHGVSLGTSSFQWSNVWTNFYHTSESSLADAASISPTTGVFHITGSGTSIATINPLATGWTGSVDIITDSAITFTTGGNIATSGQITTTAGQVYHAVYDGTSWYIK